MTPENAVGDALHLQWVAETARVEAHLPTDGEVHDGLRLIGQIGGVPLSHQPRCAQRCNHGGAHHHREWPHPPAVLSRPA